LLRDVVNLVNNINFNTADDIHTMAHLYESMLKEMRDSAGDSGEFYTPRPVIRFIVQMVKPKLGDTIFDPACGTGGFLVESYELLKKQVKSKQDREKLQYHTLRGVEKKPMAYLLGMMNLLLHEIDRPNLSRSNALIRPLNEIGDKDRVDIIVTNRLSVVKKKKASNSISLKLLAALRPRCYSSNLSCAHSRRADAAAWSCPTARSSARALALASRSNS